MKAATGGDTYNKFGHWCWTDSGMGTQVTMFTANVLGTERMLRLSSTLVLIVFLNLAVTVLAADTYSRNDFPTGFIFGAGTSAYQVEGAVNEDGRTPSIWDTFVHQGAMHGDTGDVAVDGYHKYKEDVQLMAETGLDAYRFSISWSRLIPNGRGPVNPKGLEYYNNLIDELIRHGIQPHVTLYNYDLPQALEDEYGGWISRKIVRDFTAFADVCFREFGNRVSYWTTINEPNIMSIGGYDQGGVPPMHCSAPFGVVNCTKGNSSSEPYLVMHHALLTHASSARLYREKYQGKKHGSIGLSLYAFGFLPLTNSTDDVVATQRAKDFYLGWALSPLVFGDYPKSMKENVGSRLPAFTKDESLLVKGSFDFIGLIHYTSLYIKDDINSPKLKIRDFGADAGATMILYPDALSAFSLPCTTWGLPIVLELLQHAYGNPPVFIHENGVPTPRNSSLEDTERVKCLHAFIGGALDAIRNGSNARGYFIWSFMDVFELLGGWDTSYGLYYVDLQDPDLKRYPKLSAHWYSLLLRGQGIGPDGITELEKNLSKTSHPSLASSA